jgi:NADPH2:quinone reductase
MRAAVLREYGVPEVGEFDEPAPADGQVVVEVLAAGLNPVDVATAAGKFYGGPPPLPSVAGREGVGRLEDGTRVYFDGTVAPFGSMAERTLIDPGSAIALPRGVDDALATAFGIAGLAAWLSLEYRARVRPGETVLVLGASGVVGQIGVQAARRLGAAHVVAAARSEEGLARAAELGADATIRLGDQDDLAQAFRDAAGGGVDVVLDPLWGEPALAAIEAANPGARVVNLGQSAGAEATLPSALVRGKLLTLLGHTNFLTPAPVKHAAYQRMVRLAAAGELEADVERVPLDAVADAFRRQAEGPHHKLVIVP